MIDVSIVSGTYNRLPSLKLMVASVRQAFAGLHGVTYEIVLVDGGSKDGTIEWCQQQPDIRLIEHGALLGAVKAFNDGAFAAQGNYVILANDDIEFIDDSVLAAWLYMQDHPDCGMGCFYQDRNGRDWHVEEMPASRDGQQVHVPYGQVCIVPKAIGDRVGWWGNYLHTYGGDNEISAQVYELGLKVSPVPRAKIHDREIADALRKINNISGGNDPRAVRGHHPDSWAWGRKWRNPATGLVGPVIRAEPVVGIDVDRKPRVLYLPIYEQGWEVQRQQKRGLREALAERAAVVEFDYVGRHVQLGHDRMLAELRALASRLCPTLVLCQLHNGAAVSPADVKALRDDCPGAVLVNWNGDYWPENLLSDDGIALARAFDLQLTINREALDRYRALGVAAAYWQIGWEPDGVGHEPEPGQPHFDLVFLGNGYSQARREFVKRIRATGLNFGLYGQGWPVGWSQGQNLYDFRAACRVYRAAKISLGDSQWPQTGFVSNRVFQALAAGGAALAHQAFAGMDELGLVDGQTCITWQDTAELAKKARYYLAHEAERARIAEAGQQLALQRHSFRARVEELFLMLPARAPAEEGWRW